MLRVEPGYPRSILRDFMGCDGLPANHEWDWSPPVAEERHYDNGDMDVVIKLDSTGGTEKAVAIAIPCVLALCMMVLLYTVFQFRRKSTQRHILYCKRSMQVGLSVRREECGAAIKVSPLLEALRTVIGSTVKFTEPENFHDGTFKTLNVTRKLKEGESISRGQLRSSVSY